MLLRYVALECGLRYSQCKLTPSDGFQGPPRPYVLQPCIPQLLLLYPVILPAFAGLLPVPLRHIVLLSLRILAPQTGRLLPRSPPLTPLHSRLPWPPLVNLPPVCTPVFLTVFDLQSTCFLTYYISFFTTSVLWWTSPPLPTTRIWTSWAQGFGFWHSHISPTWNTLDTAKVSKKHLVKEWMNEWINKCETTY